MSDFNSIMNYAQKYEMPLDVTLNVDWWQKMADKAYVKGRIDERRNVSQWVLANFCDCEGICDIEICKKYSEGNCIDALLETYEAYLKEKTND